MSNVIECNGFKARIMEADRLVGTEQFGLPPGKPLPVYKVSSFKKRPDNWMDVEGSVVVPVQANKGLWFDWTLNDQENTAVLPSVKGCNPITGQQIDGFTLESYQNKCPVHGVDFEKDRYCPECGYKWPIQNYVTSPSYLWLDGFRDVDGTVRQFFFTEDMMRDVASHKLGSENTVPAFGFAFYTPLEKHMSVIYDKTTGTFRNPNSNGRSIQVTKGKLTRDVQNINMLGSRGITQNRTKSLTRKCTSITNDYPKAENFYFSTAVNSVESSVNVITGVRTAIMDSSSLCFANCAMEDSYEEKCRGITIPDNTLIESKEVAVGAGAVIKQELAEDKYGISTWKNAPDAVMRVYFVFQEEFDKWASYGFVGEDGSMLSGLPVG